MILRKDDRVEGEDERGLIGFKAFLSPVHVWLKNSECSVSIVMQHRAKEL